MRNLPENEAAASRIVVFGDVMLDRNLIGRVERISPEAPVPVVLIDHETETLGGAGNVAYNARCLGHRVSLVSVCGSDEAGRRVAELARQYDIDARLVTDSLRCTTTKSRVLAGGFQQILRFDRESAMPLGDAPTAELEAMLPAEIGEARCVVLSDYLKGCVTERLARGIIEAANLDARFKNRSREWIVKTAEHFYTGLGFPNLPATFWTLSDLYPVEPPAKRKKNTHASCWHIDLAADIRSLMSVDPDSAWFYTAHHELGHAYYFMTYSRPEVPPLLRLGANPAFHEGMGELISLAASQVPYLQSVGVLPADFLYDTNAFLLNDSLVPSVPFIFWASGTMAHWEADVYARDLSQQEWNRRWWQYVRDFQGVEPPQERGEEFCDAATKTHINDTPCYYYSYAIATVLKFQWHDYIARNLLKQPPQNCNYANRTEAGDFLRKIMRLGGTQDWRQVLRDATGEDLSTRAMVAYYQPLFEWLKKQNAGRPIGWE